MKTLTALTVALMLGISGNAIAKKCDCSDCQTNGKGGYMQSEDSASTVQAALSMPDESMVGLQGKIIKRIKKDKYQFQDNTGTITVEIDGDIWNGQTVTPDDTVMLYGELDKDDDRTILEVEKLRKK